jgi:drug/metabolite transporter (DMT)-like permease
MSSWLLLVSGILFSAAVQLLLKLGVLGLGEAPLDVLRAVFRWEVMLGGGLYVLAFLLYLQVLARFDLSYAAPVMVGGVLLLVFLAGAALGEPIGPARVLGAGMIVGGIVVLSMDTTRG